MKELGACQVCLRAGEGEMEVAPAFLYLLTYL